MNALELRHLLLLAAVSISGMLGFVTYKLHGALVAKTNSQQQINASARQFASAIGDLLTYDGQWNETYSVLAPDADMLSIYESMGIDRVAPVSYDSLTIVSAGQEHSYGTPLPLYRVCTTNEPGSFDVVQPTVRTALETLTEMAARPDVRFSSVSLEVPKGSLVVRFDSLCMLLRA